MPDTAANVQALLDREAIRALPNLYCHYVWRNDVEGLVGLFAKDGVFDEPTLGRITGHAALREIYRRALGALSPKPYIHNHVVTLEGPDRASGACYLDLRVPNRPEAGPIAGYYDDRYVKEDGNWVFAERKVTLLTELTGALAQDFARAAAK
jgi:hypothetical protein